MLPADLFSTGKTWAAAGQRVLEQHSVKDKELQKYDIDT